MQEIVIIRYPIIQRRGEGNNDGNK